MSKLLTSADKSDFRAVIKDMVTNMQKIKMLKEDIKEAAKGLAEKYKDDEEITAQVINQIAKLEFNKDQIVEKQEKANTPFELYELIMSDDD